MRDTTDDASVYDSGLEFHGDVAEDADYGREACSVTSQSVHCLHEM